MIFYRFKLCKEVNAIITIFDTNDYTHPFTQTNRNIPQHIRMLIHIAFSREVKVKHIEKNNV